MMSEERKQRQLQQHGRKESTYLRLRRTKLGLDDFRTVKVIGKGAFGEVHDYWYRLDAVLNSSYSNVTRSDSFKRQIQASNLACPMLPILTALTGKIYAMKTLKKDEMLKKDQAGIPMLYPCAPS
ncbi:hypothetical protein PM082_005498 [Marasmius tenuissimus]|nr:hypothetical protein PM082_005498 [Marasmius tenuissimus]